MEPLYAVRSTYNEAMYMSQVLASTPTKNAVKKKKGFQFHISGQTWCDLLALIVLFGAFYRVGLAVNTGDTAGAKETGADASDEFRTFRHETDDPVLRRRI